MHFYCNGIIITKHFALQTAIEKLNKKIEWKNISNNFYSGTKLKFKNYYISEFDFVCDKMAVPYFCFLFRIQLTKIRIILL